ncbi:sensor histidine kinase [Enterocloster aldenensis]|uniref:cache domain-containing sensor histidine kinase n=1 Tax=Enterocloster aldenensis TaxID=358742 RepID=UPI000E4BDBAD|nr:sensor histidine kinase [Enterocloster aldenensis]
MRFYSIKTRLTVMYAVIIILLISCTSLSVGLLSSNALMDKSIISAQRELTLISEKLDLFAAKLETESLYLTRMQASASTDDPYQQFLYTSGVLSFLNDFILIQPSVESIAFYDNQGNLLYSDAKSNISAIPEAAPSYIEDFKEDNASSKWIDFHYPNYPESFHASDWVCSFLRKIYTFQGELMGILELNLSEDSFQSIYDVAIADSYDFYIMDSTRTIISAGDKSKIHMSLEQLQQIYPAASQTGLFHASSEYLYTMHTNEKLDWTLVSTLPIQVILKESRTLVFTIFLIGALAVILAFILLRSITGFIIRPLSSLTATVEEIADGNYTIKADTGTRNEIGRLAARINSMSENTLRLLDAIKKESALKRKFEFSYIQLQMNPHFLYNTLETICGMIAVDEKKKAIKMIQNVSSFYKKVLSKGIPIITIEQELELTRCYLDILQQRYCEIYTYEIRMDREAGQYRIPKLTLQPFVENALIHGILPTGKPGKITITAAADSCRIILTIKDNGTGMDAETLHSLRSLLDERNFTDEKAAGFGIISTYRRLLLFLDGPDAGISIDSVPGEGTSVRLLLPLIQCFGTPDEDISKEADHV